ncbi:MAG: crosslink repair DNA glycosylase YcaQ family protein [Elusimicrobiota bacterium]
MKTLPAGNVARLFLRRQHLDRPEGSLTRPKLQSFIEDTGGLQLDSINVLERAHYLTVWSRFGPYKKESLDKLLYEDALGYEYWAHAACVVPRAHLPAWRRLMLDYQTRQTGWSNWLKTNAKVIREVERTIADRGPATSAVFARPPRKGAAQGWWDWKPAAHGLHFLWMTGRLAVHSREHFHKRYDLADRVVDFSGIEPLKKDAFHRWHLRQSLHAMGAATAADLAGYLSFPRFPVSERRAALSALLKSGEAVEVQVAGRPGAWYALEEDLPLLQEPGPAPQGTTLLSPFDSFLWHRKRTLALFDFDYKIEVYVPKAKRKHGYYSLPILHEGALVGRLDAKNHRQERRLSVPAVHFENDFILRKKADRSKALIGLGASLRSLAVFLKAEAITLEKTVPAEFSADIKSAIICP